MPRNSKQKQWVPLDGAVGRSAYILPSKKSKAILIKKPDELPVSRRASSIVSELGGAPVDRSVFIKRSDDGAILEDQTLNGNFITNHPLPQTIIVKEEYENSDRDGRTSGSGISDLTPSLSSVTISKIASPNVPSPGVSVSKQVPSNTSHKLDEQSTKSPYSTRPSTSPSGSKNGFSTRSTLDIYAHKYVPHWLKAVNESSAVPVHSPILQRIDFDAYQSTFASQLFTFPLPRVELPLTLPCHIYTEILGPLTYEPFWKERLHNEYAAQCVQSLAFGLFDHPIREYSVQQNLYQVKIPGVRESSPRIDLGDVLLIRPLQPVLQGTIAQQVQEWSSNRDGFAPGFGGTEHHAVVWSIMRRDEVVILKLGQPIYGDPKNLRCNVIVPLQAHKNAPAWGVIDMAASTLNERSERLWLHSNLFPEMNDGILQTALSKGTFDLNWYDESLNFEQKRAIQAVVNNDYGVFPYLISGPPGTGKTKTLVEAAMHLISVQHKNVTPHFLLSAPSDAAADTLLVRLSEYLPPSKLFRLNNWTRLPSEVPGEVRPYCFIDELTNLHSMPAFQKMMSYQIVVTSCRDANMLLAAGLSNQNLTTMAYSLLRTIAPSATPHSPPLHWTALLLDEAAQATEPEALIPIMVIEPPKLIKMSSTPQIIMAGDEHQLGPRLVSMTISASSINSSIQPSPKAPGLDKSLFQRLFESRLYSTHPLSRTHGLRPLTRAMLPIIRPPFANLIRNYRSHPAILSTSSHLFYADTLIPERPDVDPAILSWPRWPSRHKNTWPVMFVQNTSEDSVESVTEGDGTGAGSLMNKREALIALELVQDLLAHVNQTYRRHGDGDGNSGPTLREDEIIIMSPFRAQVTHLRTLFRASRLHNIRIGPLEAFQGLESRIVILCTTRTRLGSHPHPPRKFVDEDRSRGLGVVDEEKRFNVAMTRAREGLVVVGSVECLRVTGDRCWSGNGGGFLGFVERNGLVGGVGGGGGGRKVPGGFVGRGSAGGRGGVGKLEKALLWREGLDKDNDSLNGNEEFSSDYENSDGNANGEMNENFKFRLMGRMVDLDERMWEMQIGDQEEENLRREEDEAEETADSIDGDGQFANGDTEIEQEGGGGDNNEKHDENNDKDDNDKDDNDNDEDDNDNDNDDDDEDDTDELHEYKENYDSDWVNWVNGTSKT